ncbi:integrase [Neosynechococcus sphagnicola sy1]|uniref:Integrase n=1 Tax=Neosynechococcus sphagnicola sy1 TaxID=1497020 RepID=A0A098TLL7_9CYAN|nr:tyrosine-type recombinase/integrase [Neosynechococcus sphagnicola]KGF73199.1 integrase [Neosynechococcus sphagnicola sy1]
MKCTIEDHNGRLRLRWLYQGKRYTMGCGVPDNATGRAVAKQKAAQIELDIQAGYFDPSLLKYKPRTLGKNATEMSCTELFERFTEAMKEEKALCRGSLERYRGCLSHVRRSLDIPAARVTSTKAGNFTSLLLESVCNRTAKEYLWMLKSCWDWAKGKYHLAAESNPWSDQIAKIKPQPQQKTKPFTVVEVRAILAGFKSDRHYKHYHDVVHFLFGVGCRPGEAFGLRWRHIADTFETCWIGESVSRGVRKCTKTGKARTILLSGSVQEMLRSRFLAASPKPDDLVFPAPKGGSINDRLFNRRAWRSVLERCNIEYRKPYSTRHTAISHALANGAHHVQVAEQTGHDARVLYQSYASVIEQKSVFVEF